MVDLVKDIHPLTDFKRNTSDFMAQMKFKRAGRSCLRSTARRKSSCRTPRATNKFLTGSSNSKRPLRFVLGLRRPNRGG